ncbi:MAG: preprotein translocase subunit SecE [Pelotomaculum sp.]
MAVMSKQDNNKKEQGKKKMAKQTALAKKSPTDAVKKETSVKKPPAVKKDWFGRTQRFLKSTFNELKKVHWPNRRETVMYTIVVLVTVLFVGVLIWLFDSALSAILRLILG